MGAGGEGADDRWLSCEGEGVYDGRVSARAAVCEVARVPVCPALCPRSIGWLRSPLRLSVATLATLLFTACPTPAKTGQGPVPTTAPDRCASDGGDHNGGAPAAATQTGGALESGEGSDGEEAQNGGHRQHIASQFDYYVLSLSWSPQFCATRGKQARPMTRSAARGLVRLRAARAVAAVRRPGLSRSCAVPGPLDATLVQRLVRIMPSQRLVQHEWRSTAPATACRPSATSRPPSRCLRPCASRPLSETDGAGADHAG